MGDHLGISDAVNVDIRAVYGIYLPGEILENISFFFCILLLRFLVFVWFLSVLAEEFKTSTD